MSNNLIAPDVDGVSFVGVVWTLLYVLCVCDYLVNLVLVLGLVCSIAVCSILVGVVVVVCAYVSCAVLICVVMLLVCVSVLFCGVSIGSVSD